ncbi:sugar transferase [Paenibacillus sp. YIM B09110]|uniref:sugar transferase n=1 Tax=Paenibacillus sp. YIM B09110 TaxID=3126102 RepID=UPI00301DF3A4
MTKLFRMNGLKIVLLLLDCFFIYVSFIVAYQLEYQSAIPSVEWESFRQYAPWLGLLTLLTYYFFNLYDLAGRRKPAKFLYNLILAHVVFIAEMIVLSYWLKTFSLPKTIAIIAFFIQLGLAFGLRLLIFFVQSKVIGKKKAVIFAPEADIDVSMVEKMVDKGKAWFDVQRIIIATDDMHIGDHVFDDIEVILLGPGLTAQLKTKLMREAGKQRIEVLLIPEFYELYLMDAETQQIDDLLVYSVVPPHLTHLERIAKRTIDVTISGILLLIASPVMLLMFVVIPISSKGKALFVQDRVGLYEKPFKLYKFRSMVDNAEKSTGPVLASDRDPRITRLGQFIRATRIDELPQLINVLAGDMSLVGPRPEREFFITQFKEELPHYTYRLMVKPGLTGLAQVMANYTTTPSDKLRYDIRYIRTYSPLLDLKILFQTIIVVLSREQSKGVSAAGDDSRKTKALIQKAMHEVAIAKE